MTKANLTGVKGLAKIRKEVMQAKLFTSFVEPFVSLSLMLD